MSTTVNSDVTAASQAVAHARYELQNALLAFDAAAVKRTAIEDRIQVLVDARGDITRRRHQGEGQTDDGPRLALIAADLDGLAALLSDASAIVVNLSGPVDQARRAVATAEEFLALAEDTACESALVEHVRHLDGLMLKSIERLHVIHNRRRRGIPLWGPSKALATEFRRLQSARQEL
jgi:hypothetical protein